MICPKCGRSTPGNICPYCDGPQIEDNTDEYIKRKKEYEDFVERRQDEPDEISVEDVREDSEKKNFNYAKVIIPVAIAGAAAIAAVVIFNSVKNYRVAPVYDSNVYYANAGKYYEVNAFDAKEVGDAKAVLFNADKSKFYVLGEADGINFNENIRVDQSMSDDNGKFFVFSVYDSSVDKDNYKLFFKAADEPLKEVVSSDTMMGIRYVSDSGRVFFTKTDVITEELGTGKTSLCSCDATGENVTEIEDDIADTYFYLEKDILITRDKSDNLYGYSVTDPSKRTKIADGADEIFAEEKECNNFFASSVSGVNVSDTADRFCYSKNNRLYMHDLNNNSDIDVGSVKGSPVSVYYDDINRLVYIADASGISSAIVDGGKIHDRMMIEKDFSVGSIIWNDYEKTALYLTSDGRLRKISSRESSDVSESNGITSLSSVGNDSGYSYVKNKELFYGSSFNKAALFIGNVTTDNISEVLKSGEYIYRIQGRSLVAVSEDGTQTKDIGGCEALWYGSH